MSESTTKGLQVEPDGALPRPFGNFTLLKSIASGARGRLFAALRLVEIERFCALKLLDEETAKRPRLRRGVFRNEATRVVRRIHGNLVQTYDIGLVDQRLAFVSEPVEGVDLATLADELRVRRLPFLVDVAVFVAMEVAAGAPSAICVACRCATVRSAPLPTGLSPRSILLSIDGEVKVLPLRRVGRGAAQDARDALRGRPEVRPPRAALPTRTFWAPCCDISWARRRSRSLDVRRRTSRSAPCVCRRTIPPALSRLIERARGGARRRASRRRRRGARDAGHDPARGSCGLGRDARHWRASWRGARRRRAREPPRPRGCRKVVRSVARLAALAHVEGHHADAPRDGRRRAHAAADDAAHRSSAAARSIPGTRYRIPSKHRRGRHAAAHCICRSTSTSRRRSRSSCSSAPRRRRATPRRCSSFRQGRRAPPPSVGSAYICDVTDFGELGVSTGRVFFVMEHLDGQSLGRASCARRRASRPRARCRSCARSRRPSAPRTKRASSTSTSSSTTSCSWEHGKRHDASQGTSTSASRASMHQRGDEEEEIAGHA